jgi:hypothetical protein
MSGEPPASNVGDGGRPVNAPSKPTSLADLGKLACPFLEAFQLAAHETCYNGSVDVKHVKYDSCLLFRDVRVLCRP